ncbi:hypothetical protein D9758_008585 [Tetrapyrgos nigripes]|uniref:DUF6534 domain-containing protein n=1 Tax=Tetrapyrgos nigripes TaxID=182062 RepID=A0A8H5G5W8_9AGAR|nr:hypothetical protein D9758_008585 [Tetrapyrgos nigripes]
MSLSIDFYRECHLIRNIGYKSRPTVDVLTLGKATRPTTNALLGMPSSSGAKSACIDENDVLKQVISLVMLDVTCSCLMTVHLNHYLVVNFGNCVGFLEWTPFFGIETLLTIIIVFSVNIYFMQQIRARNTPSTLVCDLVHCEYLDALLSWNRLTLSKLFTSFSAFVIGCTLTMIPLASHGVPRILRRSVYSSLFATCNTLFTLAELSATAALGYSLHQSKIGIKRTDGILEKLFTWMATRGLVLSVDQVLVMAVYFAQPYETNWVPFHLFQSKLYVMTMLSMLNSRTSLRRKMNENLYITGFSSSVGARSSEHRAQEVSLSVAFNPPNSGERTTDPPSSGVKRNSFDQGPASFELQEAASIPTSPKGLSAQ